MTTILWMKWEQKLCLLISGLVLNTLGFSLHDLESPSFWGNKKSNCKVLGLQMIKRQRCAADLSGCFQTVKWKMIKFIWFLLHHIFESDFSSNIVFTTTQMFIIKQFYLSRKRIYSHNKHVCLPYLISDKTENQSVIKKKNSKIYIYWI